MGERASEEKEGSRADVTEDQMVGDYGERRGGVLEGLAGMIRDTVPT